MLILWGIPRSDAEFTHEAFFLAINKKCSWEAAAQCPVSASLVTGKPVSGVSWEGAGGESENSHEGSPLA